MKETRISPLENCDNISEVDGTNGRDKESETKQGHVNIQLPRINHHVENVGDTRVKTEKEDFGGGVELPFPLVLNHYLGDEEQPTKDPKRDDDVTVSLEPILLVVGNQIMGV